MRWLNTPVTLYFEGERVYHIKGLLLFGWLFIGVFTFHDDKAFICGSLVLDR